MAKYVTLDIRIEPNPATTLDSERVKYVVPNLVQSLNFVDLTPRSHAAFLGMFHLYPEADHILDKKTKDKYYIKHTEVKGYQYELPVTPSLDGSTMYYVSAPLPVKVSETLLTATTAKALQDITAPLKKGSKKPYTIITLIQRLIEMAIANDITVEHADCYIFKLLGPEYGDLLTDEVRHVNNIHRKIKALM